MCRRVGEKGGPVSVEEASRAQDGVAGRGVIATVEKGTAVGAAMRSCFAATKPCDCWSWPSLQHGAAVAVFVAIGHDASWWPLAQQAISALALSTVATQSATDPPARNIASRMGTRRPRKPVTNDMGVIVPSNIGSVKIRGVWCALEDDLRTWAMA